MEKTNAKILVVDDEQDLCEILQFNLETEGFDVDTATSPTEALLLPLKEYDLFLLDVMMSEMSGFQLAEQLKKDASTKDKPIIFITALDGEENLLKGFGIGADDYITKPLSLKELKARVKAVLRRTGGTTAAAKTESASDLEKKAGLSINTQSKIIRMDGEVIETTKLEYDLLRIFIENRGVVFSREELLQRAWPKDAIITDRTVDVNINRLRKKIGKYGANIKTRFGFGYYYEETE